jgi:alkylation response protein AidB-like acyl-CoA dehydrogenase
LPSPLVATLNTTYVLAECEGAGDWLARIADGTTASLAITNGSGSWELDESDLSGREDEGGLVLDGSAYFVQDAFKADALVAWVELGPDRALCVVPTDSPGVTLSQDQIHDLTRDQATVRFEGVRVSKENVVSRDATSALERAWPSILVTVAADLVGCAEWQLQTTVQYAKDRKQFDRPIGFFQAVKHPLVDCMMEIDRARSLVYSAASAIDFGQPAEAMKLARMAKSAASDAGASISDRSVQLHGGIGFTWECDVHIFFKRSMHNQALYGDAVHQRSRLAETMIGEV